MEPTWYTGRGATRAGGYGTPPPAGTDTWLRQRRTGIGGSDAAAVLGVSPWQSKLGVWEAKRGITGELTPTERMLWGQRLEPVVREYFNRDHGRHYTKPRSMLRHDHWPFVVGNVDGIDGRRLYEGKLAERPGDEWGEEGTDQVPAHYFAQVQHYMMLTGAEVTDVAVLVRGAQLRHYEVPADREFQEALLVEEAALWRDVQAGTPPPPDGSADARNALRRLYPHVEVESIEATPEVDQVLREYLLAKAQANDAAKHVEALQQQLQAYMGNAGKLIGASGTATWSERAGATKWKEVAKEYANALRNTQDARIPAGWWTDEALAEVEAKHRSGTSRSFTAKESK